MNFFSDASIIFGPHNMSFYDMLNLYFDLAFQKLINIQQEWLVHKSSYSHVANVWWMKNIYSYPYLSKMLNKGHLHWTYTKIDKTYTLLFGLLPLLYVIHALLFTNVWVGIRKKAQIGQGFKPIFALNILKLYLKLNYRFSLLRIDNLEICLFFFWYLSRY